MAPNINVYHGSYNIQRRTQSVKYIVMHYVGSGTSAAGSARANCVYFAGGNRNASAHYFVDDGGIWEYADPSAYATWHCGDGGGRYGITNANSIGIEVCINGDRPYTSKEVGYASQLVRYLMDRFGVPASRVVRHYDASRKACPYYYTPSGSGGNAAWEELRVRLTGGSSSSGASGTGFGGTYRCTIDGLNIRCAPGTSAEIDRGATYDTGETVVLDDWYTTADGYVWGRYTTLSGATRYVAVGRATGKPEADDYLVKVEGTPYVVRVTSDDLNVRTGPGTDNAVAAVVHKGEAYTIVDEADGAGASKWGRLKSGAGWVALDHTERV